MQSRALHKQPSLLSKKVNKEEETESRITMTREMTKEELQARVNELEPAEEPAKPTEGDEAE